MKNLSILKLIFGDFWNIIMCRYQNVVQVFQVSILSIFAKFLFPLFFYTVLLVYMFAYSRNSLYYKICDFTEF